MVFRAENPAFGTTITYYLRDSAGADATITIKDKDGKAVRVLTGPGSAGVHRVVWDLKRQEKVTDAEIARSGAETLSEKDALAWVTAGDYTATLQAGATTLRTDVKVRKERQGLKRVEVRK